MRNLKSKVWFVIGLLILGSVIYLGSVLYSQDPKNKVHSSNQEATTAFISLPTQTSAANTVTTVKAKTPSILYSDHVFLEADTQGTVRPSSYLFDFDTNRFSAEDVKANDISFGLTHGSSVFLVIGPVNGATGTTNDKGTQNNNTDFQDCLELLPTYLKGGKPIPEKGVHYCWKTNQGRIVEFSVGEINETKGLYKIDLEYTVWDTNVNNEN